MLAAQILSNEHSHATDGHSIRIEQMIGDALVVHGDVLTLSLDIGLVALQVAPGKTVLDLRQSETHVRVELDAREFGLRLERREVLFLLEAQRLVGLNLILLRNRLECAELLLLDLNLSRVVVDRFRTIFRRKVWRQLSSKES